MMEARASTTIINWKGHATARDHLHDSSDPSVIEDLPKKDFPEEGPANRVVGFVEIDLQKDRLKAFDPDLVKDFMKDQDSI